ncbi:hypothetical protein [Streptomyces sp. NPDC057838]|uniref:hypothetical protein n=1 Tax=unclassified Streptomyces TaxID=2593676 RepID=UPI003691CA85
MNSGVPELGRPGSRDIAGSRHGRAGQERRPAGSGWTSAGGAAADHGEFAYTVTDSSWLNRIEDQFSALRCFTLDGTVHPDP